MTVALISFAASRSSFTRQNANPSYNIHLSYLAAPIVHNLRVDMLPDKSYRGPADSGKKVPYTGCFCCYHQPVLVYVHLDAVEQVRVTLPCIEAIYGS